MLPLLASALYVIQKFYLRSSRQVCHLDGQCSTPLYSLVGEITSGIAHIRAHGWQSRILDESLSLLDYSQKAFYYMLTIQQWLALAMDFTVAIIAVSLVTIATGSKKSTTEASVGLSMLNLVTFSILLNQVIRGWITLQGSFGAVSRLRTFTREIPQEEAGEHVSLPADWPHAGYVEFDNVTARYK